MNPVRCNVKKRLAGTDNLERCTLLADHKQRGLTHTFHNHFPDGKIIRVNVKTVVGYDEVNSGELI